MFLIPSIIAYFAEKKNCFFKIRPVSFGKNEQLILGRMY